MQSTYKITKSCEFQLKEFTKSGYCIKSVTFNKPNFQLTLTRSSSISDRFPDKTVTITNGKLPSVMFCQFRDGYTTLRVDTDIDGIISIEYEENKPLYTPEEIQLREEQEEKIAKYYEAYYKTTHSGKLLIEDLDTIKAHEAHQKLFELQDKYTSRQKEYDTKFVRPHRNGDIWTTVTVDSGIDTTLRISNNYDMLRNIPIKKGIHEYKLNIMHFLCGFSEINLSFDDVVNSVELNIKILPDTLRNILLCNIVVDQINGYIYSDGMPSLLLQDPNLSHSA